MRRRMNRAKGEAPQALPPLYDNATFDVSPEQFDALLSALCADMGFCLDGEASRQLWMNKAETVDEFVTALFVAEGLGNDTRRSLRTAVKSRVQQFIAANRAP